MENQVYVRVAAQSADNTSNGFNSSGSVSGWGTIYWDRNSGITSQGWPTEIGNVSALSDENINVAIRNWSFNLSPQVIKNMYGDCFVW